MASGYVIEYTIGRGKKSHFEFIEGDSPTYAVERFLSRGCDTYVKNVWTPADWNPYADFDDGSDEYARMVAESDEPGDQ